MSLRERIERRLGRGGRPLRVAYGRIFHEANAHTPLRTEREDFERMHFLRGAELDRATRLFGAELEGFMSQAELSGFRQAANLAGEVEAVPLMSALAVPGGPLSEEAFAWVLDTLRAELEGALRGGPIDGVYLALHGSMQVRGLDEAPEGKIVALVREVLGEEVPLAISLDLHANLAPSFVDRVDVLTAFRSNPHWDLFPTGLRAGRQLLRMLRGHARPTSAWRKIPLLVGGGHTIDFLAPMRAIFRKMRAMERDPKVLGAHLFMVHPFTNRPDLGWSAHVTTDGDPELAARLAEELAEALWEMRHEDIPEMLSPEEALEEVRRSKLATRLGAVSLVDTDDIVGAGAPGGNTHILAALMKDPESLRAYLPLLDVDAVERCWDRPVGERIRLTLKGVAAREAQPEVELEGTIMAKQSGQFGRVVRLDVGAISVAITDHPPATIHPSFWAALDLRARDADLIVQKAFFHYRMFYVASSFKHLGVVSGGASSLRYVRSLQFDPPVWPNQKEEIRGWREFDRIRRGLEMRLESVKSKATLQA